MVTTGTVFPEAAPQLRTTEIRFSKLLVAIDFSPQSARALEAACSIARLFDAELIVVNAASPGVYGAEPVLVETFGVNLEIARAKMHELMEASGELRSLRHREVVSYCDPIELIALLVKEERVDLVIAGSHGARGMERLALGSTSESILRSIPCPTLIVGPHCTAVQNPFRSILLSTDLRHTGLRAAQYASGLAERFHGKLSLLHAIEPGTLHHHNDPPLNEQQAASELQQLLPPDLNLYSAAQLCVEHGPAAEVLLNEARIMFPSLIVMGLRDGATLADHAPWSTLAHIVREANCPVMVVRRTL